LNGIQLILPQKSNFHCKNKNKIKERKRSLFCTATKCLKTTWLGFFIRFCSQVKTKQETERIGGTRNTYAKRFSRQIQSCGIFSTNDCGNNINSEAIWRPSIQFMYGESLFFDCGKCCSNFTYYSPTISL